MECGMDVASGRWEVKALDLATPLAFGLWMEPGRHLDLGPDKFTESGPELTVELWASVGWDFLGQSVNTKHV